MAVLLFSCKDSAEQSSVATPTVPAKQEPKPVITKTTTDTAFINKFTEMGYFDYTDATKLKVVRDSLRKHFNGDKEFFTAYNKKAPYQFYDGRFYSCGDGEELFEQGGVIDLIKEMQPLLSKIGLPVNYAKDSYVNNYHSIELNGRPYVLAQGSPLMWGETIVKFADMINAELELIKSRERIYLLTNENIYMVFLTAEQYELISSCFAYDKRPLPVKEWTSKAMEELRKIMN